MNIDLLTTVFATASVMIVAGAAYKWRRVPIVRMIRSAERDIAVHRAALAGLALVIDDARARGDRTLLEQLETRYRFHRRALLSLDPKATQYSVLDVNRFDARA